MTTPIIETPLFSEIIPEKGATKGHVRFNVLSRKPDDLALVGFCANIAASLLFERLQAQGTNLIFTLDREKATVDVLARYENDGVNLQWTPKPADPVALAQTQEKISAKTFFLGKKKEAPVPIPKPAPSKADEPVNEEEEDYLVKQLHRIP